MQHTRHFHLSQVLELAQLSFEYLVIECIVCINANLALYLKQQCQDKIRYGQTPLHNKFHPCLRIMNTTINKMD